MQARNPKSEYFPLAQLPKSSDGNDGVVVQSRLVVQALSAPFASFLVLRNITSLMSASLFRT
jgi:hypothetical protein